MAMMVFQMIGIMWVVLTSALATFGIFYCAYVGFRVLVRHGAEEVKVRTLPLGWE